MARKVSAVTGPTPGTVIKRQQTGSPRTASSTILWSWLKAASNHAEHGGRAVRSGPGLAPHGAAVALDEQHQGRLGRLVGVLPDPGTVGVGRAEGGGHRLAQRAGIEGAARFQDRQQGAGGGQQRGGFRWGGGSRRGSVGDGGCGDGGGRAGAAGAEWASSMGQAPVTGVCEGQRRRGA